MTVAPGENSVVFRNAKVQVPLDVVGQSIVGQMSEPLAAPQVPSTVIKPWALTMPD